MVVQVIHLTLAIGKWKINMTIRPANKFDVNKVIELIKHFIESANLNNKIKHNIDYTYVNQLYHHCILGGGLVLVAEEQNGDLVGIIAGIKSPNIWYVDDVSLREIVFYIEPEYRKGRIAYKLITEYNKLAKDMLDDGQISSYTMTNTEQLQKIDYSRFGYNKVEETWAVGM